MIPDEESGAYDLDVDEDVEDPNEVIREAVAAVEAVEAMPRKDTKSEGDAPVADLLDDDALFDPSESDDETVRQMRLKMVELHERLLRALADLENFRRRAEREKQEMKRYSGFEMLREFLAVVDNLERALSAKGSVEDLTQGVEMIHRQMLDLLRRSGVERIEAMGQAFDPSVHDAVARGEDEAVAEPTVIDELQSGFVMYERLLRPAMVRVAMPVEAPQDTPKDQPPDDEAVSE